MRAAAIVPKAAPPPAALPRWTRHAELLVYVVPVGGTPPDAFAAYVRLLRAHCELPVVSLSRPGAYAAELSPFRRFSWRGPGALRFRFVATTERLENVDGEDAHACRRPLGVLGVCHCPSTPDLRAAFAQFAQAARHLPPMLVRRCFAFEPRLDSATAGDCGAMPDLVMFPARHDLHDGESTVSVHLRVVLDTLAVTILLSLEGAIRSATQQQQQQHPQQHPYHHQQQQLDATVSFLLDTNVEPAQAQPASATPLLASSASSGASSSSLNTAGPSPTPPTAARGRKRQLARQRKLFGDYAAMVASVPDAMEHYLAAIDLLREEERRSGGAPGDALWLAAALEGYVFCLVQDARDRFVVEIVDRASEAVALYARAGTTALESSLIENLGWYYVAVAAQLSAPAPAPPSGVDRVKEGIWVKRLLWDALDRGLALSPQLSAQRQVEFLVQGSRMLELLGHRRRMAFFLHDAVSVLLSRSAPTAVGASPLSPEASPQRQKDLQAALLLERIAAARLGIQSGDSSATWEVTTVARRVTDRKRVSDSDQGSAAAPDDSWLVVRFHVLRQLLAIAKALGDALLVGKYALQLLEMLSWCDRLAPASAAAGNPSDPGTDPFGRGTESAAVESLQRPSAASRALGALPDGAGLYAKNSAYFAPPSSLETKTKRYFSLAASPSSTMSSAAASLSSTIANTPRMLATPRQQLSAAVSAISTKASPAFVSFGHSHGFGASSSSNASTPLGTSGGAGAPFSTSSPAGPSDQVGANSRLSSSSRDVLSDRSTSEAESSSVDAASGSKPPGAKQHPLFDLSAVRPVWDLRSREEVVGMQKKLLKVLETECGSLRPSEQASLSTFVRVDRFRVVHKVDAPLLSHARALGRYGGSELSSSGAAAAASDFFYSPFEKQQQQRKRKVARSADGEEEEEEEEEELDALYERAFPLRERIELRVVLSNPLGLFVDIQQVSAWVARAGETGDPRDADAAASEPGKRALERSSAGASDVECYPCSLTLAPYEKGKSVVLGIRSLRAGSFQVLGCFVRACNVRTSWMLPAPARLPLRIVDELPLAALSLVEVGSMVEAETERAKARVGGVVRVTMYSSETKHCELRVRNVGQRVISSLRVAVAIRKRGIVRQTAVVLDDLAPGSGPVSRTSIETERTVVTCALDAVGAPLAPLGSGETARFPFHMRLKQNEGDLDGAATASDEDEQLEWSVVYGDTAAGSESARASESGPVPSGFVRESKLAVAAVALPSLAIAAVWVAPSCPERMPAGRARGGRRTMDHSHCLAVIQVVNPTETVFRLRFGRRGAQAEPPSRQRLHVVDVGRKSSKRVAVEIPRVDGLTGDGKSLAAAVNELVELEWQTYFGTKGHLVVRESMWAGGGGDDALVELSRPPLAFEIAAAGGADAGGRASPGKEDADADADTAADSSPTEFEFIDAPRLRRMTRLTVNVKLLELVPIAMTVRRGGGGADAAKSAEIAVRVWREGDALADDAFREHVYAVGMVEKRVEWAEGTTQTRHELQLVFLSEGVFVVSVSGQLGAGREGGGRCLVSSHRPLYVHVGASTAASA